MKTTQTRDLTETCLHSYILTYLFQPGLLLFSSTFVDFQESPYLTIDTEGTSLSSLSLLSDDEPVQKYELNGIMFQLYMQIRDRVSGNYCSYSII